MPDGAMVRRAHRERRHAAHRGIATRSRRSRALCRMGMVGKAMPKLIPLTDAAAKLGVTPRTLQIKCAARRIPGARLIGRVWMLPENFTVVPGKRGPSSRK